MPDVRPSISRSSRISLTSASWFSSGKQFGDALSSRNVFAAVPRTVAESVGGSNDEFGTVSNCENDEKHTHTRTNTHTRTRIDNAGLHTQSMHSTPQNQVGVRLAITPRESCAHLSDCD